MTQRARRRQRRSQGSVRKKVFLALAIVVALAALALGGAGAWVLAIKANTPPVKGLKVVKKGATSVVFAADGSRLGFIQSDTIREPVSGKQIPKSLRQATVSIEDEHFYDHSG